MLLFKTFKGLLGRKRGEGWLSEEVHAVMEEARKRRGPVPFKQKVQKLALPGWRSIKVIVFGLVISFAVSWILCIWNPHLLSLKDEERLLGIYTTMWQIQAGIAAVALPILLFIIQLSKDEKQTATRSHEVLIRETWIFPIIVFSLAGAFRIGVDIAWFPKEIIFIADFIMVFLLTLVFTVLAYFSALKLLFSPSRMKAKAMAVAREKMNETLDASIKIRIANNRLFAKLEELKIGFWPFRPQRHEADQYLVLRAPCIGFLSDIHLARLEDFIRGLPWKEEVIATLFENSALEANEGVNAFKIPKREHVWLMKRYGERITSRNDGLIRLDKAAFEDLDPAALEAQLNRIVKIKSIDAE